MRARLLSEIGDLEGAAAAYRDALERPCTEPERRFIIRRLARLAEEGTER